MVKEEEHNMCQAVREIREEGRKLGREEGTKSRLLTDVKNIMKNMKMTAVQAMAVLEIPQDEQEKYLSLL